MNVGSLFSGIGGLDEGLRRAGHRHVFFCESDAYRRDVLRTRFPGVPAFDDVGALGKPAWGVAVDEAGASVDLGRWEAGTGLLCGGFPCQDLSVAGRRAGLAGDRSGLFFEFARIADAFRPGWLLVENVPGLLSSNGGRDFGVVLGTLADLGYGVAWRILDSRFFGVPQRRRRVFIVGAVADGDPRAAAERAGEVLAVGQGCLRHLAKGREKGQDAPVASLSGLGSGGPDDNDGQGGRLVADTLRNHPRPGSNTTGQIAVSGTLKGNTGRGWENSAESADRLVVAGTLKSQRGKDGGGIGPEETLVSVGQKKGGNAWEAEELDVVNQGPTVAAPLTKGSATGEGVNQPGRRQEDDVNLVVAPPLVSRSSRGNAQGNSPGHNADAVVAFHPTGGGAKGLSETDDLAPGTGTGTGTGTGGTVGIASEVGVRRLTPTECERLQGFADGWTQLGETPDSRRYSALGDAVTVNVSEWIGRRLAA